MWRMTPRLVTATLTATLALALATTPKAEAATVQSYSYWTDGNVSGMAGVSPLSFEGVSSGTLTTPGSFSLGQFDAAAILPPTATLTYNNTPFTIDLYVYSGTGFNAMSGAAEYAISGVLNGSITGIGTSSMVATITGVSAMPDTPAGMPATPPFSPTDLSIAPQGINAPYSPTYTDGITPVYAQVAVLGLPSPAPEPSTIAVFGLALAGWAYRRRSRARA